MVTLSETKTGGSGRDGSGKLRLGEEQREQRDLLMADSKKGLVEGSGSVTGWQEHIDRLLDSSPRFSSAVRAAYSLFCLPSPDSALPPEHLLPALQLLLEKILEDLDERAAKVCFRPVTEEDVEVISRTDEILARQQGQLIDFSTFDLYARHLLKRLALDRGKRLGLLMLGGVVVVHMAKSIVKKIPILGAVVSALIPTALAGPAVGVVGAIYL